MSSSAIYARGGTAWSDGEYLGEVVDVQATVEVPRIKPQQPWCSVFVERPWWERLLDRVLRREPRYVYKPGAVERSGTLVVQSVDSVWEGVYAELFRLARAEHRRFMAMQRPWWVNALGRVLTAWLVWRAWRER